MDVESDQDYENDEAYDNEENFTDLNNGRVNNLDSHYRGNLENTVWNATDITEYED